MTESTEITIKDDVGENSIDKYMANTAKAEILARFQVANSKPRNELDFRSKIIETCKSPIFARQNNAEQKGGWYKVKNRGEGFSIHAADEMARMYKHLYSNVNIVGETDTTRTIRVEVTDAENNVAKSASAVIEKTKQKKKVWDSDDVLRQETTSTGDTIYIVKVADTELMQKTNGIVARLRRNLQLELIPFYIKEEVADAMRRTREQGYSDDPKAHMLKIVDGFSSLGINAELLEKFLGHSLEGVSPAEIDELKGLYGGVKDGEISMRELIETLEGDTESDKTDELRDKAAKLRKKQTEKNEKDKPMVDADIVSDVATEAEIKEFYSAVKKIKKQVNEAHTDRIESRDVTKQELDVMLNYYKD